MYKVNNASKQILETVWGQEARLLKALKKNLAVKDYFVNATVIILGKIFISPNSLNRQFLVEKQTNKQTKLTRCERSQTWRIIPIIQGPHLPCVNFFYLPDRQ